MVFVNIVGVYTPTEYLLFWRLAATPGKILTDFDFQFWQITRNHWGNMFYQYELLIPNIHRITSSGVKPGLLQFFIEVPVQALCMCYYYGFVFINKKYKFLLSRILSSYQSKQIQVIVKVKRMVLS